jgi:hypothetical protein
MGRGPRKARQDSGEIAGRPNMPSVAGRAPRGRLMLLHQRRSERVAVPEERHPGEVRDGLFQQLKTLPRELVRSYGAPAS